MDFSAWLHADKWDYGSCLIKKFSFDFAPKWILFEKKSERILLVHSDPVYFNKTPNSISLFIHKYILFIK